MPATVPLPTSAAPEGFEKPAREDLRVDLLAMIQLLLDHLTPALCKTVFKRHRSTERERKWTFYAVCLFWAAMIVRHPTAIEHGLAETRKGRGRDKLWPKVGAKARAFYRKAAGLRPMLFQALYDAFTASILPQAPQAYASWMSQLRKNFPEILIVDGSRIDAICHQLKIFRQDRAKILPGCVTIFYDLFRGISRQVLFFPDAAQAELPRGLLALTWITTGALVMGDRLYASIQYFLLLTDLGLYGLFRKNGRLKIRRLRVLSRRQLPGHRCFLEDVLVEVGCGVGQPKIQLRLIRYRGQQRKLDLLTNVLNPRMLSAQQAAQLYGLRWSIERMFLDLKETLDLHTLYCSHPNLVAQQVYASMIVHTAFRIAQARIADKAQVLPEQLSPAKLFPKLAQAANDYCVCQLRDDRIRRANPDVVLRFPSLNTMPFAFTRLGSILLRHRTSPRRRRRFCASAKRWKSIAHVRGGPTFLKQAVLA